MKTIYCARFLARHLDHDVVCVVYGDGDNVAIECETCNEVIIDYDRYPMIWDMMDEDEQELWLKEYNTLANHIGHPLVCATFPNSKPAICCTQCNNIEIQGRL